VEVCSGKTNCKLQLLKSLEPLALKSRRMSKSAMASVFVSSVSFILDNTQCLSGCGHDNFLCGYHVTYASGVLAQVTLTQPEVSDA